MIDNVQDEHQPQLPHLDLPLGLRLRQGRVAAGLSVAEAAEKLRLRIAIVDAMEREDLTALGASVYVRGYYTSYARMLGVPMALVDAGLAREALPVAPQLHTTSRLSHGRYLFDRYARRAVYVVLTASIVLPVILLATRDHLPDRQALLTPLDAPIALPDASSVAGDDAVAGLPTPDASATGPQSPALPGVLPPAVVPPAAAGREFPVMASLTPFYSQNQARPEAPAPESTPDAADATPADAAPAGGALRLAFEGDSWVEVTGHDGSRLAYGLMRAGEARDFAAADVARVSLGNSEAVQVRMNGALMDISPYRRANVARFTVSSDGSLAPAGG